MLTDIKNDNGTAVAVLKGEIDHHNAKSLRTELDHYIVTVQPERFAIDFGGITFMDSSGIGMLIGRYKQILRIGGKAEMINASKDVVIGDHCWVGMNSIIMKGTIIGNNTIIGAGAIVSGTFQDGNVVLAGVPARIIREKIDWCRKRIEIS